MKTKEPKPITYDEVMAKLDELRARPYNGKTFTPQMEQVLMKARTPDKEGKTVSFAALQQLWIDAGWGKVAKSTLSSHAQELKKRASK